ADQKANDKSEANDDSNSDEAAERPSDAEHSPFAMALFEALEGTARMPRDDWVIAATDLFYYLYGRLAGMSERKLLETPQTPRLWSLPKHGLGEFVFRNPLRPPAALLNAPYRSPYPGLQAFDEANSVLFYGREKAVGTLMGKIDKPLTIVAGPSGVGK